MPEYNPSWGYGRQVLRRPEARDSQVAKANIIHGWEESAALSAVVHESVGRRKAMSDEAMRAELDHMASLIGGCATDAEVRDRIIGLNHQGPDGPEPPQQAAA